VAFLFTLANNNTCNYQIAYIYFQITHVLKNNNNAAPTTIAQQKLLLLSFIEGSCVMVAELAGGKMLAPFFGTSLYVWASTLAVTLGALTIGYYFGGELSRKGHEERHKALFITLAAASALVVLMPVIANFVMQHTIQMSFLPGLVMSQVVFLLPPIMGMGMVSPLLIGLIGESKDSGKAAGLVYAISTLGGVIGTLLAGFWLVPVIGISIPCVVIGALLFLLSVLILKPGKKAVAASLLLLLIPSVMFIVNKHEDKTDKYKVLYHTEGVLGQVKVVDFDYIAGKNGKAVKSRVMLVNHNWQTWVDKEDNDFSFLYYTRFSRAVISSLPKDSKALLIGLGGGTLARQFEDYGVSYDAVEIDGRLPHLAEQYFGLKKAVASTSIDDGRHFINVCKKKYDLIVLDALLGESVPSHLLSVECFEKLKGLLHPNGKIFIEFDGTDEENPEGVAQQLLYNTIKEAGYSCRLFSSLPGGTHGDIMYVATRDGNTSYDTAVIAKDHYYPFAGPLKMFEVTNIFDAKKTTAKLITDNNQVLDYYLKDRVVTFRTKYLITFNEDFIDDNMAFFR
jgi:predicted membrane-bound spermidine synthase